MKLRVFTEPQQGADYETLLAVAKTAEELGYEAFFRSDHYVSMGGVDGLPGPTDTWITLGAIARETSRIRLGTLVTSATFRYPGPLAVAVAQVDRMSGGRVDFGFGAGWFEAEHKAYAIPFPPLGERFDRLEEQLEIITGLWATPEGETYSFDGKHYQIVDSPALPKPAQSPRPPIVIGGKGKKRTPALTVKYADEFNVPFDSIEAVGAQFDVVRAAAESAGRDPKEIVFSAAQIVVCGQNDAEIARRAASVGREVDELRENGLCGTPDEVAAKLRSFGELGAERMYLQFLDLQDLDHLALIANEVAPQV
ncbi:TIGR03560 family F420-dependent LLM class oxidoreductase [Cryptosporangium arvum]|uniref:TIGR03560 family F420-dependent LLM class oxidoreductase n=1 Tax=Cryptosporangium arvum TaxID=80871 RepID=UPI000567D981